MKVRVSFRTNVIQRKGSGSYRLVSIQSKTASCSLSEDETRSHKLPCLPLHVWVALGICLLSCQARRSIVFCSTPLAVWFCSFWHIVFCTKFWYLHNFCFLVFFNMQPFGARILQDHEQCFSHRHQTNSGASELRPATFPQPTESWLWLVEACFTLLAGWVVARWILSPNSPRDDP